MKSLIAILAVCFLISPSEANVSRTQKIRPAVNTKALYELDFSSERQRLLDRASNCGSSNGPCPGWSSLWPLQ